MYTRLYCPKHRTLLKMRLEGEWYCNKCKKYYSYEQGITIRNIQLMASIDPNVLKNLNDYCKRECKFRHLVVNDAIKKYLDEVSGDSSHK